ncbi:hypothetical protein [Tenacibaculum bernardetii]|uniref:hypothetical protein n=1 Tax=Tenacibaculum bernardetii TaxID=3021375 RepID=UPI0023AF4B50|nr:hypothetical protein [Tenacibaculum bernardetii]
MHRQPKPTEEQIELIKELDKLKFDIWESNSTDEIITIGKKAIELSKNVEPTTYILANGTKRVNNKGKQNITEVLLYDIESLENKNYSTLEDEKFAVVSSIQLLIGVFAHLSAEELIKILRK